MLMRPTLRAPSSISSFQSLAVVRASLVHRGALGQHSHRASYHACRRQRVMDNAQEGQVVTALLLLQGNKKTAILWVRHV